MEEDSSEAQVNSHLAGAWFLTLTFSKGFSPGWRGLLYVAMDWTGLIQGNPSAWEMWLRRSGPSKFHLQGVSPSKENICYSIWSFTGHAPSKVSALTIRGAAAPFSQFVAYKEYPCLIQRVGAVL